MKVSLCWEHLTCKLNPNSEHMFTEIVCFTLYVNLYSNACKSLNIHITWRYGDIPFQCDRSDHAISSLYVNPKCRPTDPTSIPSKESLAIP